MKLCVYSCLLFFIIHFKAPAYDNFDLENLISVFRQQENLSPADKEVLSALLKKAESGKKLSVLEDNAMYYFARSKDGESERYSSLYDLNWVIYRRFDGFNWHLSAEKVTQGGIIVEFLALEPDQPSPYFSFVENSHHIYLEMGQKPKRNIWRVDYTSGEGRPVIQSIYDEISPVSIERGKYLLLFSNRDRESRQDQRLAIYAMEIGKDFEPVQISPLRHFQPATLEVPTLKYEEKTGFVRAYIDKTRKWESFELQKGLRKGREAAKPVVKKPTLPTRGSVESIEKLKTIEFSGGTLQIVKAPKSYQIQYLTEEPRIKVESLGSLSERVYSSPGPKVVVEGDKAFFLQGTNLAPRIYLFEKGEKPKPVSPAEDICFSPSYHASSNTLAYILIREPYSYLLLRDLSTNKVLREVEITALSTAPDEKILRLVDPNRVYYKNKLGDWQLAFEPGKPKEQKQINKLVLASSMEIPFQTPFQITDVKIFEERQVLPEAPKERTELSDEEIQRQLDMFPKWIQWLSSGQELGELKSRYSSLHNQVSLRLEKFKPEESPSDRIRATRWIESLNGIKQLLDNAQILIQVED